MESAGDEFAARVREAFLARAAAQPERWVVVDASGPADDVQAQVRAAVAARFGLGASA
jgi:dTMP kinase